MTWWRWWKVLSPLNRCLEEDGYCGRDAAGSCTVYKCYSVMQKKWENFLKGVTIDSLLTELSEEEIEKRMRMVLFIWSKKSSGTRYLTERRLE